MNAYSTSSLPSGCEARPTGLLQLESVAQLPPAAIVEFLRSHPDTADGLLQQSYDKRYTPSTFLEETEGGFRVGWFDGSAKHVQEFADFSEAAADYLLFSFGRGRLRC